MSLITPSTNRRASLRRIVLIFEIASSIGFRSGEYGGSGSSRAPRRFDQRPHRRRLVGREVSSTTTCPGTSVGANPSRTNATKVSASVAPSNVAETLMPPTVIAAIVLRTFQCPCGTLLTTRSPRGARPCVRCIVVVAAEFVDKHELIHPHVRELLKPALALRLHVGPVLLGGVRGLFFRGRPRRSSVRLTVLACVGLPSAAATSSSVASGLALISARIAASSASL
jgi:hypothetical protein